MKVRLFHRKVTHCNHCPHIDTDINITRYVCKHKDGRGKNLGWIGYGVELIEVPDWCPLPVFPGSLKEKDITTILQEFLSEDEMKM